MEEVVVFKRFGFLLQHLELTWTQMNSRFKRDADSWTFSWRVDLLTLSLSSGRPWGTSTFYKNARKKRKGCCSMDLKFMRSRSWSHSAALRVWHTSVISRRPVPKPNLLSPEGTQNQIYWNTIDPISSGQEVLWLQHFPFSQCLHWNPKVPDTFIRKKKTKTIRAYFFHRGGNIQ